MKKEIKINFTDFYHGFNKTDNYIYQVLTSKYLVIIDEINPDYLFYSCFGQDFLNFDCVRIFYSGENIIPDFNLCDYATGFAYLAFEDRYIRFPNFVTYGGPGWFYQHKEKRSLHDIEKRKGFCNFIYSNGIADPTRDKFYHLLSGYKGIDSPGRHLNNIQLIQTSEHWSKVKVDFMSRYKFSIAFENSSLPGYTTEKIVHAFFSGTIPIYWGDPLIHLDFNPNAFINCHDYKNFEEVVKKVVELDENDELYLQMINEPIFIEKEPDYMQENYLLDFYNSIIEQPLETARRRTKYGQNLFYEGNYKNQLIELESYRKSFKGIKGLIRSALGKIGLF